MAIRSLSHPGDLPAPDMQPGTRLRRARERLGLTYRDVERASYELACQRSRPDFIVHLSRLADIENRDVTPSLYKLYALAVIYHLDPKEVCEWYEVPFEGHFSDASQLTAPKRTWPPRRPSCVSPFGLIRPSTRAARNFLHVWSSGGETWKVRSSSPSSRYLYGYVGVDDMRMHPLLRPGSLVLVDPKLRQIKTSGWTNEYERPVYFIELHGQFRCCWCQCEGGKVILVPDPLSSCAPEVY